VSAKPWFAWFPADYRAKTAHLTFEQDGAYRRLLDAYYERRGPLPANPEALYRLTSAQSPKERSAIDAVAAEFFTNGDGTLCHNRCDEQIAKEQALHQAWSEAGRKGGLRQAQARLKHPIPIPTPILTPNPNPTPTKPTSKALSGKPDALAILQFLNEKTGRRYQPVKANLEMIAARLADGATPEELRQVVAKKCREWQGDEKMEIYLRPATLFNRTKFAQYQGELVHADRGND
jgi:uncharacterized phage protein (TIGR02220 family)